jgi:hypothetical protein
MKMNTDFTTIRERLMFIGSGPAPFGDIPE